MRSKKSDYFFMQTSILVDIQEQTKKRRGSFFNEKSAPYLELDFWKYSGT